MKNKSKKQILKDREVAKIKSKLSPFCFLCGRKGIDACHILPKSIFPEYYTIPENLIGLCRSCHCKFDDDLSFRQKQIKLYEIAKSIDEKAAYRHFKL